MSSFIPLCYPVFDRETKQFLPYNPCNRPREERLEFLIAQLAQGILQDSVEVPVPTTYTKLTFSLLDEEPYKLHYYLSLDGDQKGILTDIGKTFCYIFEGNSSVGMPLSETIASNLAGGPFSGNELEVSHKKPINQVPPSYWNDWKEKPQSSEPHRYYTAVIYPFCRRALGNVVNEKATILEICAGDGESTAEMICGTPQIAKYYAVDLNEKSIQTAKERLGSQEHGIDFHFLQADITKEYALPGADKESIDVCVGIGALTRQVLPSKEAALSALRQINFYLRPGGWLILSGAEGPLLTAEDLTQAGFHVTNKHIPNSFQNFYLAQKRIRDPKDADVQLVSAPQIREDYFLQQIRNPSSLLEDR